MSMPNWDERYAGEEFFYGTAPNDFLKEQAHRLPPNAEVLCLGEGEGRNAVHLATLGHRVSAVDGSSVGLAKMGRLARERGVQVTAVVADLADYDPGEARWDCITSIWCHLPSTLRRVVHAKCVRALRPGGLFLLEAYTPDQLRYRTGGPPDVDYLLSRAAAESELAGLEPLVLQELEREVHEGRSHGGRSAVVQVVARKPA